MADILKSDYLFVLQTSNKEFPNAVTFSSELRAVLKCCNSELTILSRIHTTHNSHMHTKTTHAHTNTHTQKKKKQEKQTHKITIYTYKTTHAHTQNKLKTYQFPIRTYKAMKNNTHTKRMNIPMLCGPIVSDPL